MNRLFVFLMLAISSVLAYGAETPEEFATAVDLIHSYGGSGDELVRADRIARDLSISHPRSGYAEALIAEAHSTWTLNDQGQPAEVVGHIITLTSQALDMNPRLALAYVARGRALVRASRYEEAETALDAGLKIAPDLHAAHFQRAEIYRRTARPAEAEKWYRKFIDGMKSEARKSNGYWWMGRAYVEAAHKQPANHEAYLKKAQSAYDTHLTLGPDGPWKNVNYAIFLNNEIGDFDQAEKYALKALTFMDFPMGRYHLAIARYQKVYAGMGVMSAEGFRGALNQVELSTSISLADASDFARNYAGIGPRLRTLQERFTSGK